MTYCVMLASKTFPHGAVVSAWERQHKGAAKKEYDVLVSRNGDKVARSDVHRCAKTTWQKKFREICAEEGR